MDKKDGHWHLDKRVSLSHIVTTAIALVGVFWWAGEVETRIAVLENDSLHEGRQIQEIRQDVKEIKQFIMNGNGKP